MKHDFNNRFHIPPPQDIAILDIEASSLNGAVRNIPRKGLPSYAIEVGVSMYENGRYHTESKLIRPPEGATDWQGEEGNPDIGFLHRISRTQLIEEGETPQEIVLWLDKVLAGKTVMCDSPHAYSDTFWLDGVYARAGAERTFDLHCIFDYIDTKDEAAEEAYEHAGLGACIKHRAGDDALRIMRFYNEYYKIKNGASESDNAADFDAPSI